MKKSESKSIIPTEQLERSIYVIRGQKVMLDADLAVLYGVETRTLNQALKRNLNRFPEDFVFQLTKDEWEVLRSQFVILKEKQSDRRGSHSKYLPYVFTEHGVAMAANLLKSDRAVAISVEIVRAFIRLREFLGAQKELAKELAELKEYVLKNSLKNDREFKRIWDAIEKLSIPPTKKDQRQIGFDLN